MSRMTKLLPLALVALAPAAAWAQAPAARSLPVAVAARVRSAPGIDGRLDDAAWQQATVISGFTQRDPNEGEPASEATEVRIVYDDEAIYVGARMHDRRPVTQRLGRRDMQNGSSDWFRVSFDSYRDRVTAFRFEVNPSGVRRDATITGSFTGGSGGTGATSGSAGGGGGGNNTSFTGVDGDLAWDAVWDAATSVDGDGWTAEMRIPFSQLRFAPAEEQSWGLQLERIIDRTQEISQFAFSPRSEQGGVSSFGDLTGLRGIRPGRPLEVVPYVLSEGRFVDPGSNPFRDRREYQVNAGVDARYRLTSNLTLSATVNPDFGQVEVDPAVINLSAFETRYDEKRPFFVEGSNSFRFGGNVMFAGALTAANLLYTRRIGRAPQIGLTTPSDLPETARILGAGKLTGKTANGWSLGLLNAVTGRESGRYLDGQGVTQHALVEPLTNYFVGRLNREMRRGRSAVGAMLTGVNRSLDESAAPLLRSSAYTGGIDASHEWANRGWYLGGFLLGSEVRGSPQAILLTQRSSTRYFQRPDAENIGVDPTATSLAGTAATVQIRKQSGEHWTGDLWVGTVSPAFEINDIGFQQRADQHGSASGIRYTQRKPGKLLRTWNVHVANELHTNYDWDVVDRRHWIDGSWQLLNYWRLTALARLEPARMDDRFTRGGPLSRKQSGYVLQAGVTSDPRKNVGLTLNANRQRDDSGSEVRQADFTLAVRTSPRWNLALGPQLTSTDLDAQYVTAVADPAMTATYGTRYVFAPLRQTEFSVVTRLNYTFTPDLSLELYAQPLVADGRYGTPKQFQRPGGYEFATYGTDLGTLSKSGSRYTVDPDGAGPLKAFTVADRTFTTRSLRGNAVLRWEYRPGSTFYLVWQQERLNPALVDEFRVDRAVGTLLDAPANNVLVLKWSYWFNP
jgi:hypothetical protein